MQVSIAVPTIEVTGWPPVNLRVKCGQSSNTTSYMEDYYDGILFPEWGPVTVSAPSKNKIKYEKDKRRFNNLHLLPYPEFQVEGVEELPKVPAFTGPVPNTFIPFTQRGSASSSFSSGVHCFEYDYRIQCTWSNALAPINSLKRYPCVIAPDFSLMVDQPRAINVTNLYRNRWVACFWVSQGIRVIPSASWGSAESFSYCFDGLPENSIIAIGHAAEGKTKSQQTLFQMGTEELILRKNPKKLVIYGAPLNFNPGVEVLHINGVIQKLRAL